MTLEKKIETQDKQITRLQFTVHELESQGSSDSNSLGLRPN